MVGPRNRRVALVLACLAAASAWAVAVVAYQRADRVTFSRDIAPIGHANCAPCHRPGQSAPFSLLSYADYREHAKDIADVVEDRYMPPWKPSDRGGRFLGQRSLSDDDIALIRRWVSEGKHEGDPSDLPPQPKWPKEWQLGDPDAVVQLDTTYSLAPSGLDEYRNFVIASPVHELVYVVGWEFRAQSRAIHHAILKVDRLGNARRADAADPAPGFGELEFEGAQAPDGFYLVWAPGKVPLRVQDGSAWRLDPRTDLVLQLHLQRTGKVEPVSPKIALYFSKTPPVQRRYSVRIGDLPIDIAPGDRSYRMVDSYVLPADTRLLGMFPHAHYLAKRVRVFSTLPGGQELELLRIDDWDFNWQDEYAFAEPPVLPRGSTLQMEFVYDNSADNVRNPSRPPRRVRNGTQSTDEMGNVTFQAMPVRGGDLDVLLESKYRRQLARAPSVAEMHYNLANTLSRRGKSDEAVFEYRAALQLDPRLAMAHTNLGGLLESRGELAAALTHLEAALALRPDDDNARLTLGHVLVGLGRVEAGIAAYRQVVEHDAGNARAAALLADALRDGSQLNR